MTDEQLYADSSSSPRRRATSPTASRRGKGTLGQLLNNPESARQLEASLKNLTAITNKINAGQGSIGQLDERSGAGEEPDGVTSNFESLSSKLNKGEGTMGKLMNEDALYQAPERRDDQPRG